MARIYAGTSGWVYRSWRAQLYAGAPVRRWLEIASREFSSLEINGSFYTQISQATYARWRTETPAAFLHGHTRKYASSYSAAALRRWAADAVGWRDRGLDVFVYFDNDAEGHAVRNARTFAQLIEGEQPGAAVARPGR